MKIKTVLGSETEYGLIPREGDHHFLADYGGIQKLLWALDSLLFPHRTKDWFSKNASTLHRLNWWNEDLMTDEWFSADKDGGRRKISEKDEKLRRLGLSGSHHLAGGRFYVDGEHAEHSTPECLTPQELVVYERAGDELMREFLSCVEKALTMKADLLKRNWDYSKASYACHENYLVSRPLFDTLVHYSSGYHYYIGKSNCENFIGNKKRDLWLVYLISRLFITGSGRFDISKPWPEALSLSQRQPFITETSSSSTMDHRALINTRDRPYADPATFGRLHVISGDSNRSDWSILLRSGVARLVLLMLENVGFFKGGSSKWFVLKDDPAQLFAEMNGPDSLIKTESGTISALKVQMMLFEAVEKWLGWLSKEGNSVPWAEDVMLRWRFVLQSFEEANEDVLSDKLDWLIKKKILGSEAEAGASRDDLQSLDYNYHVIGNSLFDYLVETGEVQQIFKAEDVAKARNRPPKSRAFLRAALMALGGTKTEFVGWHGVGIEGRKIINRSSLTEFCLPDPRNPDVFYFYEAPAPGFLEELHRLLERGNVE